jgi:hypothetical protein
MKTSKVILTPQVIKNLIGDRYDNWLVGFAMNFKRTTIDLAQL